MSRLLTVLFTLVLCPVYFAQTPATAEPQQPQQPQAALQTSPLMREYRGVKLGINRDAVKAAMGKTARSAADWDEFKLGGGDLMTVRYDNKDAVKTIQLYFTDPAHAPKWTEVVGNAEIQEKSTGSKYARAENKEENFWVTMFQSNTGAVTTVTLSR
jgi:hypothetical protein